MEKLFMGLGLTFLVLLVLSVVSLLSAWPVMVGLGILNEYYDAIPALSFWESFWIVWAWSVVWNRIKFSADDS